MTLSADEQKVARIFVEAGYSNVAIAALIARGRTESGSNPKAHNAKDPGARGSVGLFQWNRERLDALDSFAEKNNLSPDDIETQARFAVHELSTTELQSAQKLRKAKSPIEAGEAVMGFVRPGKWTSKTPRKGNGWNDTAKHIGSLLGVDVSDSLTENTSIEGPATYRSVMDASLANLLKGSGLLNMSSPQSPGMSDSGELIGRRGARDRSTPVEESTERKSTLREPSLGEIIVGALLTGAKGLGEVTGSSSSSSTRSTGIVDAPKGPTDITGFLRAAGNVGPSRIR